MGLAGTGGERTDVAVVRMQDPGHTCVTLLLSLGVPPRVVMEIVGHSALETTMNAFGHVALEDQRQALDSRVVYERYRRARDESD